MSDKIQKVSREDRSTEGVVHTVLGLLTVKVPETESLTVKLSVIIPWAIRQLIFALAALFAAC